VWYLRGRPLLRLLCDERELDSWGVGDVAVVVF
jgi:hypothetical protein